MDRITTFKTFIAKSPADPFPRYGLAMELKTQGDLAGAWAAFDELIQAFPDYVASYLMAGGTLVGLGRKTEAAALYERGIAIAGQRGDSHARGELATALAEIS
jgi:hypothetical protein